MKNKEMKLWLMMGVVNAVALFVVSSYFPADVVLGNDSVSGWLAAILTGVLLTVLLMLVEPALKIAKLKVKGELPINITYGLMNIAGLWVIARGAKYIGFGISSFWTVIALGVVLTLLQFAVWKIVTGKKGK